MKEAHEPKVISQWKDPTTGSVMMLRFSFGSSIDPIVYDIISIAPDRDDCVIYEGTSKRRVNSKWFKLTGEKIKDYTKKTP